MVRAVHGHDIPAAYERDPVRSRVVLIKLGPWGYEGPNIGGGWPASWRPRMGETIARVAHTTTTRPRTGHPTSLPLSKVALALSQH